jgi:colanic acid biosynthesis glycosyl transferase WcaI
MVVKMKILVYGINYYPESIGIGKYTAEMCEWLAGQGHHVSVITAMPSYPHWQIIESYRGKIWHTEYINGVKVYRSPLYVPKAVTGKSRIVHELSFALSSMVWWAAAVFKRYDVIFCVAPPLQTGLAGLIYKIFHRTLLIYHIQDLQLDAAKQLKLIQNQALLNLLSHFEKFILDQVDYVSTISEGMKRKLVEKGVSQNRLKEVKNWTDTNFILPETPDPAVRQHFDISPTHKIFMYSGNIGEKQGLDIIIPIAQRFKSLQVTFLIIGDGAFKEKFQAIIQQNQLHNIKLFPLQPYDRLSKVLNLADAHLVIQKRAAADLVMPSKLTNILAAGGLAIVTTEPGTSLYQTVHENDIGITVEPENSEALENALMKIMDQDLSDVRKRARAYALKNLERNVIMSDFQKFLTIETARH